MVQLGQHLRVPGTGTVTSIWFEMKNIYLGRQRYTHMYRHIYFIYAHTNRYTYRENCQLLLKNRLRSPSFKKTKTEKSQGW